MQRARATSRTKKRPPMSKRDEQRAPPWSMEFLSLPPWLELASVPCLPNSARRRRRPPGPPRCVRALLAPGRQRHMHARVIHG